MRGDKDEILENDSPSTSKTKGNNNFITRHGDPNNDSEPSPLNNTIYYDPHPPPTQNSFDYHSGKIIDNHLMNSAINNAALQPAQQYLQMTLDESQPTKKSAPPLKNTLKSESSQWDDDEDSQSYTASYIGHLKAQSAGGRRWLSELDLAPYLGDRFGGIKEEHHGLLVDGDEIKDSNIYTHHGYIANGGNNSDNTNGSGSNEKDSMIHAIVKRIIHAFKTLWMSIRGLCGDGKDRQWTTLYIVCTLLMLATFVLCLPIYLFKSKMGNPSSSFITVIYSSIIPILTTTIVTFLLFCGLVSTLVVGDDSGEKGFLSTIINNLSVILTTAMAFITLALLYVYYGFEHYKFTGFIVGILLLVSIVGVVIVYTQTKTELFIQASMHTHTLLESSTQLIITDCPLIVPSVVCLFVFWLVYCLAWWWCFGVVVGSVISSRSGLVSILITGLWIAMFWWTRGWWRSAQRVAVSTAIYRHNKYNNTESDNHTIDFTKVLQMLHESCSKYAGQISLNSLINTSMAILGYTVKSAMYLMGFFNCAFGCCGQGCGVVEKLTGHYSGHLSIAMVAYCDHAVITEGDVMEGDGKQLSLWMASRKLYSLYNKNMNNAVKMKMTVDWLTNVILHTCSIIVALVMSLLTWIALTSLQFKNNGSNIDVNIRMLIMLKSLIVGLWCWWIAGGLIGVWEDCIDALYVSFIVGGEGGGKGEGEGEGNEFVIIGFSPPANQNTAKHRIAAVFKEQQSAISASNQSV